MKTRSKTVSDLPVSAALAVDLRAKALMKSGVDVVSFCVGEPDCAAPEAANAAGICAIESGGMKYTNASGAMPLRAAIADALERDYGLSYGPGQIVVTPGAKYAVYASVLAIANPGDEIILPAPYWASYYQIVRLAGAVPVTVPCLPENCWKLTAHQLANAVTEKTKALILNNPNNPTGAVYSRGELAALLAVCREQDLFVIADEIYGRLCYTEEPFCAAASVSNDAKARVVTINGVSKAYAMTGWRIGYAASDAAALVSSLSALLSHTVGSPNTAAQAAAEAALRGFPDDTERMRRLFFHRRDLLIRALSDVPGLRFTEPEGAFYVLLDVRGPIARGGFSDEADFALRLLNEAGVAAVPCADFGAPGCLRLSYTLEETRMLEGVRRLAQFLERSAS